MKYVRQNIPWLKHNRHCELSKQHNCAQKLPGTEDGPAEFRKGAEDMVGGALVESIPGQGSRFWIELPQKPNIADAT